MIMEVMDYLAYFKDLMEMEINLEEGAFESIQICGV
jgi:hypothetical protein